MDQMMCEKFTTTFHVESPGRKITYYFLRQIQNDRLNDRISDQKLVYNLYLACVRSPVFLNRTRKELRAYHDDCRARRSARFPSPLNAPV